MHLYPLLVRHSLLYLACMEKSSLQKLNANKSPIALAKEVLLIEAAAVEALAHRLNEQFTEAVNLDRKSVV